MKFRYTITIIIALSMLILPACTRSASTALPVTVEPTLLLPSEAATEAVVEKVISPTPKPTKKVEATEAPQITETTSAALTISTAIPSTSLDVATAEYDYTTTSITPVATASEPAFQVFSGYEDGYPTIGIRGVVYNESVTLQANDFPANTTYTVSMSRADTNGVGLTEVASLDSGEGGTFYVTIAIPESLTYVGTIAVRVDFPDGNYANNWFYNITTN